jgi:hypothetical protein
MLCSLLESCCNVESGHFPILVVSVVIPIMGTWAFVELLKKFLAPFFNVFLCPSDSLTLLRMHDARQAPAGVAS